MIFSRRSHLRFALMTSWNKGDGDVGKASQDGDRAHYLDGATYDESYQDHVEDIPFYCELVAAAESVLYLGAGTGRIAVPMARHMKQGAKLTCIERMTPMIDVLKQRIKTANLEVFIQQEDFLSLELPETTFDLVVAPFNVLMHVHEQAQMVRLLTEIEGALTPSGRFAFDVLMPDLEALSFDPDELFVSSDVHAWGQTWHYAERFFYDPVTQIQHIEFHYTNVLDASDIRVVPLSHRQFFPQELRLLLSNFDILSHHGDFDGGALDGESESQVVIAAKKQRR